MTVHSIEIEAAGGGVRVSAAVEVETPGVPVPDRLWYEVPAAWADGVTDRADGFAVAVVLLASVLGERLEVRGALSPRLAYGLDEYLRVFRCWYPEGFHPVPVVAGLDPEGPAEAPPHAVATAFSGGVDSSFTLWSHLPEHERHPDFRLSHGVFVHGFDIPLADEATFATAAGAYGAMLDRLGLSLVPVRTNARAFTPGIAWELAHGAALLSVPLVLGRLLRRFYVPASTSYADVGRWGSDPLLDHLLSTETLDVVHDGAGTYRADKVAALAGWPTTYDRLRVCWERPDGLRNCGRCYNCLLTMSALAAAGALDRFTTFPDLALDRVRAAAVPDGWQAEGRVLLRRVREAGLEDLAAALEHVLPGPPERGARRASLLARARAALRRFV